MKSFIRNLLAACGLELRRLSATNLSRATQQGALQTAIQNGLQVNSVIDVGAAFGHWTRQCHRLLPQARYLLIEPLSEYDRWLDSLVEELSDTIRVKAAASNCQGQATFYLHQDWVGSSLYRETEGPHVDGNPVPIDTFALDDLVQQHQLAGPFMLKLDVQGAELKVLEGAEATLAQTAIVQVETSLFNFFQRGALIHEVIDHLRRRHYVIYDIVDPQYRLLDNALGQVDLIFVPEHSSLRQAHVYAAPHQRQEQTKRLKSSFR